jgi:hypothetical protein
VRADREDRSEQVRRRNVLGLRISDRRGDPVGTVVDTYPYDGGGEIELVVVRLGRLGERRMVPVASLLHLGTEVRTNYSRGEVEDSPVLLEGRHAAESPDRAKSYWSWENTTDSLPRRWQQSSGSFATVTRFRTDPRTTTTAS